MQKNICVIENSKEFHFILEKINRDETIFIPLNLEVFLLCKKNNLYTVDLNELIDNDFHKKALTESENFINKLSFTEDLEYSLKSEIVAFIRFRFNSIIFLIEIIEKIKNKFDFNYLIISGWSKEVHNSISECNIISDIICNIFPNLKIKKISEEPIQDTESKVFKYFLNNKVKTKSNIILNNLSYNFNRLAPHIKKKKLNLYLPFFSKTSILKRIYYHIIGIKILSFKKDERSEIKKKNFLNKIDYTYEKYNLSNTLNNFKDKLNYYFNDLDQKIIALKKVVNDNNFIFTISNISRGLDGAILDKNINTPSLCISHGTIAKSFDKFDVIYKKIIAEAVFNGFSKFFAIQSKSILQSLQTHHLNGKSISTGNIIFSSKKKNKKNKNKYVLYAVTQKDFYSLQFFGVDMYYEFISVLNLLEKISKENKIKILVKIHASEKKCVPFLKKRFKSIIFSNKKIENLLTNASALISFSSSVIEDSLNSEVPVVLFDFKKRYKHFDAETDIYNKGCAVYYVKEKEDLYNCILTIKNNKIINFDKYIYKNNYDSNIKDKILPLINLT